VPPPGYGGIEAVVDLLCDGLVDRGHDVTLFAAPGSRSPARVHPVLDATHPDAIGTSQYESDHVALVWEEIESVASEGRPFDVLHDHSGFTASDCVACLRPRAGRAYEWSASTGNARDVAAANGRTRFPERERTERCVWRWTVLRLVASPRRSSASSGEARSSACWRARARSPDPVRRDFRAVESRRTAIRLHRGTHSRLRTLFSIQFSSPARRPAAGENSSRRESVVARRTTAGCLPNAPLSVVPVSPYSVWRGSLARIPGLLP